MPEFPYSDNLYSGLDDSDDEDIYYAAHAGLGLGNSSYVPGGMRGHVDGRLPDEADEVLSPSDGYFGRSPVAVSGPGRGHGHGHAHGHHDHGSAVSGSTNDDPSGLHTSFYAQERQQPASGTDGHVRTSSQVPHVPNVWVSDPSLEQGSAAESKAREAAEERAQNRRLFAPADQDQPNTSYSHATLDPPSHSSTSTSSHQRGGSSSAFSLLNPQPSPTPPPPRGYHGPSSYSVAGSSSTPYSSHRYTPSSSTAAPSRSRRSATIYSERSSLFSEAPPAYTPSPTSPSSASSNYQTFSPPTPRSDPASTMGRASESEEHGLLAGQTYQAIPQSMGGAPDENGHFTHPRPTAWRDRLRAFNGRRHWKLALLALVLTFVTVGFLVSSVRGVKNEKSIKFPGGKPDNSPVTRPGEKVPVQDDDGVRLAYPPFDGDMPWNHRCAPNQLKYQTATFKLEFSEYRNLSVFQDVKNQQSHDGQDVFVSGDIVVRRSGADSPGPAIVLETTTNDDRIDIELNWDDNEQRLYILTPLSMPWTNNEGSPCVQIRATIWVPANSVLDSLNIEGVHLGIQLLDNLSLHMNNFARLASTVGAIASATDGETSKTKLMHQDPPTSYQLDTRYIEVKTMSASISGSWPLYDYLGLETISGTITAGVIPKSALEESPRPAILYAKSTSGHIEVYEPITQAIATWAQQQPQPQQQASGNSMLTATAAAETVIPPRRYGVDLRSMSGAVKASVAFSQSCKVHTTSGHVDLTLLPVLREDQAQTAKSSSFLETSTTSGTTAITVLDALWSDASGAYYVSAPPQGLPSAVPAPAPPTVPVAIPVRDADPYDLLDASPPALRVLTGRHSATSATIRVKYPASWEGYIDADCLTGRIDVAGNGVQIIRQDNEFPGIKKHILARKGQSSENTVKVHTTSGNIGVLVGS